MVILYVWFHFIFGSIIYDKNNEGMMASFNKIDSFINQEIMSQSKDCYEDRGTMNWKVAFKFIRNLIMFLNDNMVTFGLLAMLFFSYNESLNTIISETVRYSFSYLFVFIAILIIFMFVWPNIKKLFTQSRKEYKVPNNPGTYVSPDGTDYSSTAPIKPSNVDVNTKQQQEKPIIPAEKKFTGRMYDKYLDSGVESLKNAANYFTPTTPVKANIFEEVPGTKIPTSSSPPST